MVMFLLFLCKTYILWDKKKQKTCPVLQQQTKTIIFLFCFYIKNTFLLGLDANHKKFPQ